MRNHCIIVYLSLALIIGIIMEGTANPAWAGDQKKGGAGFDDGTDTFSGSGILPKDRINSGSMRDMDFLTPTNDMNPNGMYDDPDNFPEMKYPGLEDDDSDGIANADDPCPKDTDNDFDGDGVCGDADNCPYTANSDQLDSDADGFGDVCDQPCDLSGDRYVNDDDLSILNSALGTCTGDAGFLPEADYNHDGCVNQADYSLWNQCYMRCIQ